MFMYNDEIRLKLQIGVFRDLYKRELISKLQLEKCIEKTIQRERKRYETTKNRGILPS